MKKLVIFTLITLVLTSCSVVKRKHLRGYYVTTVSHKNTSLSRAQERGVSHYAKKEDLARQLLHDTLADKLTKAAEPKKSIQTDLVAESFSKQDINEKTHQAVRQGAEAKNVSSPVQISAGKNLLGKYMPIRSKRQVQPSDRTHPLAIISLVLGIAPFLSYFFLLFTLNSLFLILFLPLLLSIAAIVTANRAKKAIDSSQGAYSGKTFANLGLILGIISLTALLTTILLYILLIIAFM